MKDKTQFNSKSLISSGLTRHQLIIYGLCKNYGAEIQVDINDKGRTEYTLVEKDGNTETIRKDTFEKLRKVGAIRLKWTPHDDVERWGYVSRKRSTA
jgi:hypothetical protein